MLKPNSSDVATINKEFTTLIPQRVIRMEFSHDEIGDGLFTPLVEQAMQEILDAPRIPTIRRGYSQTLLSSGQEEFIASNGVRVTIVGCMQLDMDEYLDRGWTLPPDYYKLDGVWHRTGDGSPYVPQEPAA